MDDERRDDLTSQILRDFAHRVSEQVVTPAFAPGQRSFHGGYPVRGQRRLYARMFAALFSTVILAGVIALAVTHGQRGSTNGDNPTATSRPSPGPDVIELGPGIVQPEVLEATNGKLWVSGSALDGATGPLLEFDARTGTLLRTIPLTDGGAFQIASGGNSIWLRTQLGEASTHVVEINARTGQIVANVALQFDGGLAVTPGAVWTVNGPLGLVRIDPRTGHTVATIPLPGGPYPPSTVTAGPLGVFLGSPYDGDILRVDEQTDTVHLLTRVGTRVNQMVELGTALWVSTGDALVEVSVSTGKTSRTIELGAPILGLASDGHSLWVTTDRPKPGSVRVDPSSGEMFPVTLPAGVAGLFAVASDPSTGETWATASSPRSSLARLEACSKAC